MLYHINLASFIRYLELDNIYNAGKFSLHYISPEKELRGYIVQTAFVDLKTRLLGALVMDEAEKSPGDGPQNALAQLMAQTLPLDGASFGLYADEDQDYIVGLVKKRHDEVGLIFI